MIRKVWEDESGKKRAVLGLPGDPPDDQDVPSMPPDLDLIDWDQVQTDIHNTLVEDGILTWLDLQVVGTAKLVAPLRRALINLYKGTI